MPKSLRVTIEDEEGREALKRSVFQTFSGQDKKQYAPISQWTTQLMQTAWGAAYHSTRQNVVEALQIAVFIHMHPQNTHKARVGRLCNHLNPQ